MTDSGYPTRFKWADFDRWGIWVVLVTACAFRLAAVTERGVTYLGGFADAAGYMESARILAGSGELTFYGVRHSALVMPGFVAVISPFFMLGVSSSTTYALTKLLLLGFSLGSTYVLYRIGAKIGNRRVGLVAAAIFALSAPSVYAATMPITENPFTFLVLAFVLAVLKCGEEPSWRWFSVALTVLVAGVYIRQTMLGLVFPAIIYLLIKRYPARMMIMQMSVAIVVVILGLSPWIARNTMFSTPLCRSRPSTVVHSMKALSSGSIPSSPPSWPMLRQTGFFYPSGHPRTSGTEH